MFYTGWSKLRISLIWLSAPIIIILALIGNLISTGKLWDNSDDAFTIISLLILFISLFSAHFYKKIKSEEKASRCTKKIIGYVSSMSQSNVQIGEQWLLDITVSYLNQNQEIKMVEPDMHYIAPPRSPIPLKYNPNNPEEVVIDYEAIKQGDWDDSPAQAGNTQNQFSANDINSIIQAALAGGSVQSGKHGNANVVVQDSEPTIIKASDINASDNPELASIIEQLKQTATTQKPTSAAKPQGNSTSMIKITDISPQFFRGANTYEISGEVSNSDLNGKSLTFRQILTTEQAADVFPGRMLPCQVSGKSHDLQVALLF